MIKIIWFFEQNSISDLECDLIRRSHSVLTVHAGYSLRQSFWSWPSLAAWTYRWNRTDAEFGTAGFSSSWGSLQKQRVTELHTRRSPSLWDQAIGEQISVISEGRDVVLPSVPLTTITGLIPQSLQLQTLVTLVSLGSCCKAGECAKSCARKSVCYCSQSAGDGSINLITWQSQLC